MLATMLKYVLKTRDMIQKERERGDRNEQLYLVRKNVFI